jgi:probable addiction module antidote protein
MSEINVTPFDASEYLDNEETIAAYLTDAIESGNEDVMLAAFRDVAKARGMTKVAAAAGVQRESLYKSLADGAKPRFETILRLMSALGVRFVVTTTGPRPEAQRQRVPRRPLKPLGAAKSRHGPKAEAEKSASAARKPRAPRASKNPAV